jgi:hypothetical protein
MLVSCKMKYQYLLGSKCAKQVGKSCRIYKTFCKIKLTIYSNIKYNY